METYVSEEKYRMISIGGAGNGLHVTHHTHMTRDMLKRLTKETYMYEKRPINKTKESEMRLKE